MKKSCLSALLALVLVIYLSSSALADEIRFLEIPWLSDYETVMETAEKLGVVWEAPKSRNGKLIMDHIERTSSNRDMNYQCVCSVSTNNGGSLKVAGYGLSGIVLYFAFVPGQDGTIDHSLENTSFYMACYDLKVNDYKPMVKDLMSKLSVLYGKPKVIETKDGCDSEADDIYKWSGENDTFVYLAGESDALTPSIRIYYGTSEGDTLIKNAENIQRQMEYGESQEDGFDLLMPTQEEPAAPDSSVETEGHKSILIVSGRENEYAQSLTLNAKTEFEYTYMGYFLPAGTYKVTNQGEFPTQITIYINEKQKVDGWEEFKIPERKSPLLIFAGDTKELVLDEGEFVKIGDGDTVLFEMVSGK